MSSLLHAQNLAFEIDDRRSAIPYAIGLTNRSALRGGKRFRPGLVLALGPLFSGETEAIHACALAAERVHGASLLHDDVIDEAEQRRGKPTLNAGGRNRRAVLAGDLLLANALKELSASVATPIVHDLCGVLVDLSEGEWLQLEARGRLDVEFRHLLQVARKKTASLLGWCFTAPARVGGLAEPAVDTLREIGLRLGVAFQMLDDCLDFDTGSGKPYAQDLREGQIGFVTHEMLIAAPEVASVMRAALGTPEVSSLAENPAFRRALGRALREIRLRVETELAAARDRLASPAFSVGIQNAIEAQILEPFHRKARLEIEKLSEIYGSY